MVIAITTVVLLAWAWALRRPAEMRKSPRTYADFLARAVESFAKPFLCVAVPASLLSAYLLLSARDDDTTRRQLQRIEEGARAVYDAMKPFDLNPALAAVLLLLLYALAVLAFRGHPRLPRGFVRLRNVFSLLYALASAATLFTFLGRGAGELQVLASGRLNQLDEMERTYGSELAQAASAAVNEEILLSALDRLPQPLAQSLRDAEEFGSEWAELDRDHADAIKLLWPRGPSIPELHRRMAGEPPQPVPSLVRQPRREWHPPDRAERAQADATVRRMRSAIEATRRYRRTVGTRLEQRLSQLGVEDAAAVRAALVEAPFGAIKFALSGLSDRYPLLGMLADLISKAGADQLDRAAERAMAQAAAEARGSMVPDEVVARASRNAVREVVLSPLEETPTARALVRDVAAERQLLADARYSLRTWLVDEVEATLERIEGDLAFYEQERKSSGALASAPLCAEYGMSAFDECALRVRKAYMVEVLEQSKPNTEAATRQMLMIALKRPRYTMDGSVDVGKDYPGGMLRPGVAVPGKISMPEPHVLPTPRPRTWRYILRVVRRGR